MVNLRIDHFFLLKEASIPSIPPLLFYCAVVRFISPSPNYNFFIFFPAFLIFKTSEQVNEGWKCYRLSFYAAFGIKGQLFLTISLGL